jgi:hypothetical protein
MTLFQILTRYVACGKIKVTRRLLNRVLRETRGKSCSKRPAPRKRKRQHFSLSYSTAFVAILTLQIGLFTGYARAATQPIQRVSITSGYSAAALFNQANAYARGDKPGLAILNYERAQLLAPHDPDIATNLHLVRAKALLPDAPETWVSNSLTYFPPNAMAWVGSFGFVLAGGGIFLALLLSRRRVAFLCLTFAGGLLIASAIGSAAATWPKMTAAVIIGHDVPAYTSPVSAAETTFTLREGETVTVRAIHQDFVLVQTTGGRAGWVSGANLARVVPQAGNLTPSPNRT